MSITTRIQSDELDDLAEIVETLGEGISGDAIKLVMGMAMKEVIQQHFYKIAADAEHHETATRFGAARTGLYLKAGDRTHDPQLESDGVSVSVQSQAIAQRLFGGVIEAVNAQWLTIPARTEAYGRRAGSFTNLRFILFGPDTAALVGTQETGIRKRGGKSTRSIGEALSQVFFWLKKSVTQLPDPTVLPTDQEILDPVIANAQSYIAQLWS